MTPVVTLNRAFGSDVVAIIGSKFEKYVTSVCMKLRRRIVTTPYHLRAHLFLFLMTAVWKYTHGVEILLHTLLNLALDSNELSALVN